MKLRLLWCCALLLAACSAEPAAYLISGTDVCLTVERIRPNFWTKKWDLSLVVRRNPDCQRRYTLKPTSGSVRVDVYTPQPGVYILRQNTRWYVTELKSCGFEAYQEPPPEPGDLVGTFQEKAGVFTFVANPSAKAE
jgi:hypothetical protein